MLSRLLEPRTEAAYGLLRLVAGLMWAFHGVQKLFGVLTELKPPVGTQLWFGGLIELGAGVLVAAGAVTPWAALLASGTMAVAYVQFHWKGALGAPALPAVNQGELALLYCLVFLFVACRGGGRFSVDGWRSGGNRR